MGRGDPLHSFDILHSSFDIPMWGLAMSTNGDLQPTKVFDLSERTAIFGERVIRFAKTIKRNEVSRPLILQLVRSGTSIGANYAEADDAGSRNEFFHRISICQRESRESMHRFRMLVAAEPICRDQARELWSEAKELNHIFAAIHRKKSV